MLLIKHSSLDLNPEAIRAVKSLLSLLQRRSRAAEDRGFLFLHIPIFGLFFLLPAIVAASGGLLLLIGISVFSNDGIALDQFISENYSLRRCMRQIRDKDDYDIEVHNQCSYYAEFHLVHLAFGKKEAATEACALSFTLREYHRSHYRITSIDEEHYSEAIEKDCSHPDVQYYPLRASLSALGIYDQKAVLQEFKDIKSNNTRL